MREGGDHVCITAQLNDVASRGHRLPQKERLQPHHRGLRPRPSERSQRLQQTLLGKSSHRNTIATGTVELQRVATHSTQPQRNARQSRIRIFSASQPRSRNFTPESKLVLLRYKFRRERCPTAAPPQHGQRDKRPTIAAMSLLRMVAIEFGMCRSGRKGGSSGSVTVG